MGSETRGQAQREMTLDEWVDTLPQPHRVRRELAELKARRTPAPGAVLEASGDTRRLEAFGHWLTERCNTAVREDGMSKITDALCEARERFDAAMNTETEGNAE